MTETSNLLLGDVAVGDALPPCPVGVSLSLRVATKSKSSRAPSGKP